MARSPTCGIGAKAAYETSGWADLWIGSEATGDKAFRATKKPRMGQQKVGEERGQGQDKAKPKVNKLLYGLGRCCP